MTTKLEQGRKKLAFIGPGSSGLITLKMASEFLPDWDVVCYEKSGSVTGCWGNPYAGFVSTSTRYTTQFACYTVFDGVVKPDADVQRQEFFRDGEYGAYLDSFVDHFNLRKRIQLHHHVELLERNPEGGWAVTVNGKRSDFDAVIVCTGLAAKPKQIHCNIPQLKPDKLFGSIGLADVKGKTIAVMGGGESAVDIAHRLAMPDLQNRVYLSLRSGIRVSPRYHPIRGVPSDFLRNRLLLSIHPDIRNFMGEMFVGLRIRFERTMRALFPARNQQPSRTNIDSAEQRKRVWSKKLKAEAKDKLFNMFHNKSDDFLDAVGEERIRIVGRPLDLSHTRYLPFGGNAGDALGKGYGNSICELVVAGKQMENYQ